MKRKRMRITGLLIVFFLLFFLAGAVIYGLGARSGKIIPNHPSETKYPVRGVDVSSYQGEIDWQVLASQGIRFAFIKATEGSGFVDPCFSRNMADALGTDLKVGAYHFFSYDSGGETQADNFIRAVPNVDSMLPPVIDLEFYGNKRKNPPGKMETRRELTILLNRLEKYYGKKPILYVTDLSYRRYIAGAYEEYPIWIRSVYTVPGILLRGRKWTFWQYTDHMELDGYSGEERYIDMNVYHGSLEEFEDQYPS